MCWQACCWTPSGQPRASLLMHHFGHAMAGWSVYDKIHLRREPGEKPQEGKWLSLGELLKKKADEDGVRVCMLVWDDISSVNAPFLKTDGLMVVHDEDTKRFFADSKVQVWLALLAHRMYWHSCERT